MIKYNYEVSVNENRAKLNKDIFLFRGNRNIHYYFSIKGARFTFSKENEDLLESSNAIYAAVTVVKPNGVEVANAIAPVEDGLIHLKVTEDLIDEEVEVGDFDLVFDLFDDNEGAVTIPKIKGQFHVQERPCTTSIGTLSGNVNVVNQAVVDLAIATQENEQLIVVDDDGKYVKTTWAKGDKISVERLNKIEEGIKTNSTDIKENQINLIEDDTSMEGISDSVHDTLTTTNKKIIPAINEVSDKLKDIANNFTTEQTDSSFIIKYGNKIIAEIPLNVTPSSKYTKLKGKSWSILGDSLSAYNITPVPLKYWNFVSDEVEGMELHHYGIEGQRIYQFTERYQNMNESDIITVLGGINDYFGNTTLGTITDDSVRTYYGALNVLARGLKTKFPNSLIIFITPMKAKGSSDTDEGHNFKGTALESYVQAIKDVCTAENLPCIDLYSLDIITWDNIDTRTYDGLHWEQETYELVAQVLLDEFIKHNIPSLNDEVAVQSISLTDSNVSIFEGSRKIVTANVLPVNAGNKLVHWSTNNLNVATIEDGMITSVGIGNCIITAETDDGSQSARCNVKVVQQTKNKYTAYVIPKDDGGCIDLGYAPVAGDNIDFVFSDSETSANALKVYFGHRYFVFGRSKNTLETMYINNGGSVKEVDAHSYKKEVYNTKCSIGMYTDGLYYNDVKITSTVNRNNNYSYDNYNVYLFGYNYYNDGKTINPTKCKFYALRVTNNNILTHEFVAYKDEKGIPCVYDKVTSEYHYPKEGGNLQFGNDVNTPCTNISLDKTEVTLADSNPVEIKCIPVPITTTDSIVWTTSKDSIAKIIDNKIVGTGLGNCIITATCGNQIATCNVTVNTISEYEEYKRYIDVTGKCVVDTGYTRIATDDIQLIFKDTDDSYTNSEVYFGSQNTFIGRANNQPTKLRVTNNLPLSNDGYVFDSNAYLNNKTIIKLGQKGIYIDGVLTGCYTTTNNVSVGTVVDAKTLTLFAQNYYDTVENAINHSNYRFYALTVIDSITGNIKHDFVPREDSNGKVCIYDRITDEYHYDVKGGTLTLGND